jgi:hypothetical protein
MFALATAYGETPLLQTKGQNSRPEMKRPNLLFKYYVEGARTLHLCIEHMRVTQAPFEPSDFGRAMDLLEQDLLAGLQKRFEEYRRKASPTLIKQFHQMILEANFKK